ncbi:hypothetical protein PR202_ga27336 [Eleusine coracana subsp. coracana]|uniref:Folylpolyglutamate synthase n=1 Tax=Eleusine coracana subsp. coracana TaxID=191504 RepID=A0AAV5DGJ5_ELECO|nr:hypothetical protein PR202_ga27336 [Eleusine coracana subsp. coracana]
MRLCGARGAHHHHHAAAATTNPHLHSPPTTAAATRTCLGYTLMRSPLPLAAHLRRLLFASSTVSGAPASHLIHRAMASGAATQTDGGKFDPAAAAADGVPAATEYEEVLGRLSSLITQKVRAHSGNRGNQWDLMAHYLKILELEEPIARMKVIHVAGTKGKEKTDDDVPMPPYFRFLALLAFKIFSAEQVDVAVLEVGLGGKFDATNVVKAPVVCGISSLGYDHMEILGNTLGEIAGEKAGIFKKGVPAYTAPQTEEAMMSLKQRASELGISLQVADPLEPHQLKNQPLGLHGEHQYMNAGLAVALASTWLEKQGQKDLIPANCTDPLPDQFIRGLSCASLQGRAQVVPDSQLNSEEKDESNSLVFYLDGAHSPERVHFDMALFVPNQSQYNKLGSSTSAPAEPEQIDLSWQLSLQEVWEKLLHGSDSTNSDKASQVFESLPLAIEWLRKNARENRSTSYQVLVTGSLHLIGDVLRLIKK